MQGKKTNAVKSIRKERTIFEVADALLKTKEPSFAIRAFADSSKKGDYGNITALSWDYVNPKG